MKTKKVLSLLPAAAVLLISIAAFSACGNGGNNTADSTAPAASGENASAETTAPASQAAANPNETSGVKFVYITSEQANTLAIDTEGAVWQMHSSREFKKIDINAKITAVDAGAHYAVALDSDGNVWTWGANECGQLGDGTTADNDTPQQVFTNAAMISAGADAVMAVTKNNELYAWGSGWSHKLPKKDYDNTENCLKPTKYESDIKFAYAECGKGISNMVLDIDGNRYCWGDYTFNMGVEPSQIGSDTTVIPYYPLKVADDTVKFKKCYFFTNQSYVIDADGNLYGAGGKDAPLGFAHGSDAVPKFTQIAAGTKFTDVCALTNFCIALDAEGNVWAWGKQNGITTKESVEAFKLTNGTKFTGIAVNKFVETNAYAIDENGTLYTWGESTGATPTAVAVNG